MYLLCLLLFCQAGDALECFRVLAQQWLLETLIVLVGAEIGANMREWRHLRHLQELNLKGCYKIEDAGLQGLSLLTGLTSINMQECWQITADGLSALSGIVQNTCPAMFGSCLPMAKVLKNLELCGCRLEGHGGHKPTGVQEDH